MNKMNFLSLIKFKKIKSVFIFFISIGWLSFLQAADMSVYEVKRNITLADEDPVYKDFYINAGSGSGLKKNLVVTVKRRLLSKDTAGKTVGEIETQVGQLKIIHVDTKVSVGREFKLIPRDEEVMLDQVGIMVGDSIDLTHAVVDQSKPRSLQQRKINSTESNGEVEPAAHQKIEAPSSSAPTKAVPTPQEENAPKI